MNECRLVLIFAVIVLLNELNDRWIMKGLINNIRCYLRDDLKLFSPITFAKILKGDETVNAYTRVNMVTTAMLFLLIPFLIINIIRDSLFDRPWVVFIELCLLLSTLVSLVLNEKKFHTAAKRILLIATNLSVFAVASLVPRYLGLNFLFTSIIVAGFMLWQENKIISYFYPSLSMFLVVILELTEYNPFGLHKYDAIEFDYLIRLSNIGGSFVFLITCLALTRWLNHKALVLLLRNQREVIKLNRELDLFVYSASHDLKSPLSSIQGLVNLARMESQDLVSINYFNLIEGRVSKLNEFIFNITNYSRNGRAAVVIESVSLNQLVVDVCDNLKYMEGAPQVRLIREFESTEFLSTDKLRLSIIISNLISNALKYHDCTKGNSWVKIALTKGTSYCQLTITDNGIGIEPSHQPKVFDMFYRATDRSTGSGVGLYVVKESVEKLGGEIKMSSVFGEGTEFKIKIPEIRKA